MVGFLFSHICTAFIDDHKNTESRKLMILNLLTYNLPKTYNMLFKLCFGTFSNAVDAWKTF